MRQTAIRSSRQRGRPRRQDHTHVSDELLRALGEVLARKSPPEITLKEVAEIAGTSQEMVRYYYKNKEGLLNALVRQSIACVRTALASLEQELAGEVANPTERIVRCLTDIYLSQRAATKIYLYESARSKSASRESYLSGRSNTIVEKLREIVVRLIERGTYAAYIDPAQIAVMMMSLTGYPVRLLDTLSPQWVSEDTLRSEEWIDTVVKSIDGFCRR